MKNLKVRQVSETEDIIKQYSADENVIKGGLKVVISTDTDVDGTHIASLLLNFFNTYLPEVFERLYKIETPIAVSSKGTKVLDWCYKISDINNLNGDVKYMKGLGSWTKESLNQVIKKDGFENMLTKFEKDAGAAEALKDWFDSSRSNVRKDKIKENDFSLIKI